MMLTPSAVRPYDRRHMPPLGAIVAVHVDGPLRPGYRWRRFIVESFPLAGDLPAYVTGRQRYVPFRPLAHCVNLRALDNGARFTVSAFWCEVIE